MRNAGLIELALVFGSVLAILIFELVATRRLQRKDRRKPHDPE